MTAAKPVTVVDDNIVEESDHVVVDEIDRLISDNMSLRSEFRIAADVPYSTANLIVNINDENDILPRTSETIKLIAVDQIAIITDYFQIISNNKLK